MPKTPVEWYLVPRRPNKPEHVTITRSDVIDLIEQTGKLIGDEKSEVRASTSLFQFHLKLRNEARNLISLDFDKYETIEAIILMYSGMVGEWELNGDVGRIRLGRFKKLLNELTKDPRVLRYKRSKISRYFYIAKIKPRKKPH